MRSWDGSGNSFSVTWDGRDGSGKKVPDGTYNLALTGSDQAGIQLAPKTNQVIVDTKPPTVTNVSVSPASFSPRTGQTTKINYTLSESCYVTIKIYNAAGTLVRTLVNNVLQSSGARSVTWNGKSSSGTTVAAGTYTVKISVADKAGNKATPYPITKTVTVK
jgi:flagellar hook assembly protein FlgD